MPEFLALYPGLSIDLRLSDNRFDLIEGSYDLALRNSALKDSSLRAQKLADDTRILCASHGYLQEFAAPVHPRGLDTHLLLGLRNQTPRTLIGEDGTTGVFDPHRPTDIPRNRLGTQ